MAGLALYSDENIFLLGYLNSIVANNVLNIMNPTINYPPGTIGKIPMLTKEKPMPLVKELVSQNIGLSKEDWDDFEISWDFKRHPFLNNESKTIEHSFELWDAISSNRFAKVKANEEKLNEIFIELYGLEDELNLEVDDSDVTIRKADLEHDIKSFISYAIGCMFGRYSLDQAGLVFAGGQFDHSKYSTFAADKDNIIPITDEEYFGDDIVSRFVDFVRVAFSEETLNENLDFIAGALTKRVNETSRQRIRRYFMNEFYTDHVRMYQKCPIYWQFDSGRNLGFKALVYMHRYEPGLAAQVRTDYLHLLQRKYESEIARMDMMLETDISQGEKTQARRRKESLQKQLLECQQYDQVIAHVAHQRFDIDLDVGVKVNYAKFQQVEVPQGEGKRPVVANVLKKI